MATIFGVIADSTSRLFAAAVEIQAAALASDEPRLRVAIKAFWLAQADDVRSVTGVVADVACKRLLTDAGGNRQASPTLSARQYCFDLRDLVGNGIDPAQYHQTASSFIADVFAGSRLQWKPAAPENRKLITKLPECPAADLNVAPVDLVTDAVSDVMGVNGLQWRSQDLPDVMIVAQLIRDECAAAEIRVHDGSTHQSATSEVVNISKKELYTALRISATELRNRLKSGEVKLARPAGRSAKQIAINLSDFTEAERSSIRAHVVKLRGAPV